MGPGLERGICHCHAGGAAVEGLRSRAGGARLRSKRYLLIEPLSQPFEAFNFLRGGRPRLRCRPRSRHVGVAGSAAHPGALGRPAFYEWQPEHQEYRCLLCNAYATEGHMSSDRHRFRVANPNWYMADRRIDIGGPPPEPPAMPGIVMTHPGPFVSPAPWAGPAPRPSAQQPQPAQQQRQQQAAPQYQQMQPQRPQPLPLAALQWQGTQDQQQQSQQLPSPAEQPARTAQEQAPRSPPPSPPGLAAQASEHTEHMRELKQQMCDMQSQMGRLMQKMEQLQTRLDRQDTSDDDRWQVCKTADSPVDSSDK